MVTQTSQFAALKRVLWFMEHRRKDYSDDRLFPNVSYDILKKYVDEKEHEAKIISEANDFTQRCLTSSNVPCGETGE